MIMYLFPLRIGGHQLSHLSTLNTPWAESNLERIFLNYGTYCPVAEKGSSQCFWETEERTGLTPIHAWSPSPPFPVNSKADYGMDGFGSDGRMEGGACSLASQPSPRCLCLSLGSGGTEIPDSSALSRSFRSWGRLKTARGE